MQQEFTTLNSFEDIEVRKFILHRIRIGRILGESGRYRVRTSNLESSVKQYMDFEI